MARKKLIKVYTKVCSYKTLYTAFDNAKKNKRYRKDVLIFSENLEKNIMELRNELKRKTYKVGKYKDFYIFEPKRRLIMSLPFRDRIVQWAIHLVIGDFFETSFIEHSYACIPGRGTHLAVSKMQRWLRQVNRKPEKYYYLKMDIAKFFYRIDHDLIINILKDKIEDTNLLWLLELIVRSEHDFGLQLNYKKDVRVNNVGIPIGNLTSQLLANIYLNELDKFVKHELGVKYYSRYMDDMVILYNDKKQLNKWLAVITSFLNEKLKLELNNKTCVRPICSGLEFLGYNIWWSHIKLKKKTALRMKRNLKRNHKKFHLGELTFESANSTFQSYKGILKHCDSHSITEKINDYKI